MVFTYCEFVAYRFKYKIESCTSINIVWFSLAKSETEQELAYFLFLWRQQFKNKKNDKTNLKLGC